MVIVGAAHAGFTVKDVERSLRFYADSLGIEHTVSQVSDQPYLALVTGVPGCSLKIGFARIEGDNVPLELIEYVNPHPGRALTGFGIPGTPHLCWQVDDLAATYDRLLREGIRFYGEPYLLVDGPWAEAQGAFLRDPDGVLVELIEPQEGRNGSGRLVRMHHVGLTVSDLDQAVDFYCSSLSLVEWSRYEGENAYLAEQANLKDRYVRVAVLLLPGVEVYLELWEFRTPSGPPAEVAKYNVGSAHLCFLVDDIVADHARLSKGGVQFVGPPAEVTAGVNKGARAIYFAGPDNVPLELFQKPISRLQSY
jgi:catechol 2,3-dioxygenase-like lactoylglutathione lyase family enzyme